MVFKLDCSVGGASLLMSRTYTEAVRKEIKNLENAMVYVPCVKFLQKRETGFITPIKFMGVYKSHKHDKENRVNEAISYRTMQLGLARISVDGIFVTREGKADNTLTRGDRIWNQLPHTHAP